MDIDWQQQRLKSMVSMEDLCLEPSPPIPSISPDCPASLEPTYCRYQAHKYESISLTQQQQNKVSAHTIQAIEASAAATALLPFRRTGAGAFLDEVALFLGTDLIVQVTSQHGTHCDSCRFSTMSTTAIAKAARVRPVRIESCMLVSG